MVSATGSESVQKTRDPGPFHGAVTDARGQDPELCNAAERGSCDQIGPRWRFFNNWLFAIQESHVCSTAWTLPPRSSTLTGPLRITGNGPRSSGYLPMTSYTRDPRQENGSAVQQTTSGSTSRAS